MPFMKPYMVKLLREQFPPGTRIRLDSMMNDPQPIPKGMTGTVQGIDDAGQLLMEWDNGRGLSLVPGEDDFSVVKPQKLKLYMPLELGYYEKNDWGDYGDEELALSDNDAVGYADTITGALERESKFLNTPRGFMEYYNRSDGIDAKVRSLFFKAEARNSKLWGVAECMVSGELNGEELAKLKDYIAGQASDGFGESVEQHEIRVGSMELYAHLWQAAGWSIQTEQECFAPKLAKGLPELCFFHAAQYRRTDLHQTRRKRLLSQRLEHTRPDTEPSDRRRAESAPRRNAGAGGSYGVRKYARLERSRR